MDEIEPRTLQERSAPPAGMGWALLPNTHSLSLSETTIKPVEELDVVLHSDPSMFIGTKNQTKEGNMLSN